jgi:5-methylcytosine-specific restriction endonuclease McrA
MGARRFRPAARVGLFLAAQGRCAVCGEPLRPGWHADHVKPAAAGGRTEAANGQALCPRCNLAKGSRPA